MFKQDEEEAETFLVTSASPQRKSTLEFNTESHCYEQNESEVWKHHQLQRFFIQIKSSLKTFLGTFKILAIGGHFRRKKKYACGF
jgi:hypothetical protein